MQKIHIKNLHFLFFFLKFCFKIRVMDYGIKRIMSIRSEKNDIKPDSSGYNRRIKRYNKN